MKPIKVLGLVVIATLTTIASVSVGPAMATDPTTLCDVDPGTGQHEVCPQGHEVTHVHSQSPKGREATILNSVGNVTCSVLLLATTLGLGNPLVIHESFTYSGCVRHKSGGGTENCTVAQLSASVLVDLLKLGHELADVTYLSGEWQVKCGFFINCTYSGEGLEGDIRGPLLFFEETESGGLLDEATLEKVGSGLCPIEAKLDITTATLGNVYITE